MGAAANAYIIAITAVLPLYMENGFVMIGNAKYDFFVKVAAVIFILSLVGTGIRTAFSYKQFHVKKFLANLSVTDFFILFYMAATSLSYIFSKYKSVAFWGYSGWYMGLFTQLLLIWSYFFVSRCYKKQRYSWNILAAAAVLVFLLGVLNRYGIDPLGAFKAFERDEWNYWNLLSTIGNINWYCGYICLALPLLFYLYWAGEKQTVFFGAAGSFTGISALISQGSASGLLGLAGVLLLLFCFSLADEKRLTRFCGLLFMTLLIPPLLTADIPFLGRITLHTVDPVAYADFAAYYKMLCSPLWYIAAGIVAIVLCILILRGKTGRRDLLKDGRIKKIVLCCIGLLLLSGVVILFLCQISEPFWKAVGSISILRIDDSWGTNRGALWHICLEIFSQGNLVQKLLGAGPDCFACVAQKLAETRISLTGKEQGLIFANAHNEWLNMLVTGGLLGASAYLGIFLSMAFRLLKRIPKDSFLLAGLLMLTGYAVNNCFSFQQIITTPMAFVILGMLDAGIRSVCKSGKSSLF